MTQQTIVFQIEGKYRNGDNYFDKQYDIFELAELLENLLTETYESVRNSETPIPETLIIRPINADGDLI